jgi:ectoine hydroxylase-related dioxygenase (phytanoyl-CoA dioxygenase family)
MTSSPFAAELDAPFTLPPEAIAFYRDRGYVKLKDVLSPALLRHYDPVITDAVFRLNRMTKPMAERTTYEKAFLQVMNLWRASPEIQAFVFSRRLARLAAELMGVEGVRLYHDQALYKEPGGGITPWHADQYYWPLASDKTITVWIPLQETPLELGPLAFAERSQAVEIGRDQEISDASEALLAEALRAFPLNDTPFALGEVSFHSGWTYHRAGANTSTQPRRVMTVIYMDRDIRVAEPAHAAQRNDLRTWLDNRPAGALAAGPLNPVLYP